MAKFIDKLQKIDVVTDTGAIRKVVGGSFKGIPFFVESAGYEDGRKISTHSIVNGDRDVNQDTGRVNRTFSFTAYFVGDNTLKERDRFIALAESGEPGLLRHPYYGTFTAKMGNFSIRHSKMDNNYVTLDVSFYPTKQISTTPTVVYEKEIKKQNRRLIDTLMDRYKDAIDFINQGQKYLDLAQNFVTDSMQAIEGARNTVKAVTEYQSRAAGILSNISATIATSEALASDVVQLVTFTNNEADAVSNSFEDLLGDDVTTNTNSDYNPTAKEKLDEALEMAEIEKDNGVYAYAPDTERKLAYLESANNFQNIIRGAAITKIAEASAELPTLETSQVFFYIDRIKYILNNIAYNFDTDTYNEIATLRSLVLEYLDVTALNLKSKRKITAAGDEAFLQFAGKEYDDTDKLTSIMTINEIKHPLFIEPGKEVTLI